MIGEPWVGEDAHVINRAACRVGEADATAGSDTRRANNDVNELEIGELTGRVKEKT